MYIDHKIGKRCAVLYTYIEKYTIKVRFKPLNTLCPTVRSYVRL